MSDSWKKSDNIFRYRDASVYIDRSGNYYAIPCGYSPKDDCVLETRLINVLSSPVDENAIGNFLLKALADCFSVESHGMGEPTAIEKYLGVKSWTIAVRDKKNLTFFWNENDGYVIVPMVMKKPRHGFEGFTSYVYLGFAPTEAEIGAAFLEAAEKVTPYVRW